MNSVPVTKRQTGKANPSEVKGFQARYPGVKVDGKVGDQTWGQVLLVEMECQERGERIAELENAQKPKCTIGVWLVAAFLAVTAWFQGMFEAVQGWFWSLW